VIADLQMLFVGGGVVSEITQAYIGGLAHTIAMLRGTVDSDEDPMNVALT
jgi:hypothetical protein